MKKLTFLLFILFTSITANAQILPGINYQALLRNADGQPLASQTIMVQVSILHGSETSAPVYTETHNATTNAFGQINLSIGEGEPTVGVFDAINWGNGPFFLKTAVDLNQSGTFQELEVMKFYSVPYSYHSNTANVANVANIANVASVANVAGGVPSMTYTERDAIENPYEGMMILNLNTGKLNYFFNNRWYEPDGTINSFYSCGDLLIDYRDGQKYQTLQIGTQCWMAENLNVGIRIDGIENQSNNGVIEKYCYDNTDANCDIYGGLYQWDEMMQYVTEEGVQGICPAGWHIPTDNEWKILEGTVDSQYPVGDPEWDDNEFRGLDAGGNLKETGITHWNSPNTGATNSSGFTALPGGNRDSDGAFYNYIINGLWWSSSQQDATYAWDRILGCNDAQVYRLINNKSHGFSVRCLKD